MNQIQSIYNLLLAHFGRQGWWPVTPLGSKGEKPLTPVYGIKNHNEKQKLEVVFGSLLTQNTAWKNVERAITEMNKKGLIGIDKILKISHDELAQTIKSSGYFNQKAKKLNHVAEFLKKYPIRKLEKMNVAEARELLLNVNGIGKETADSILLYALNKPIFVVDAYTKRITGRIGYRLKSYEELQNLFMKMLHADYKLFNEYHALLVELGKRYCRKKPDCEGCPLNQICKKDLNSTIDMDW